MGERICSLRFLAIFSKKNQSKFAILSLLKLNVKEIVNEMWNCYDSLIISSTPSIPFGLQATQFPSILVLDEHKLALTEFEKAAHAQKHILIFVKNDPSNSGMR